MGLVMTHEFEILTRTEILEDIPVLPDGVPVVMPQLPPRLVVNTAQQFKAISDPVRTKILGIVQNQPATAKQIADLLQATPGAIGHHLRVLEEAGLVQVVARRSVRGIIANYYTRTARLFSYELPPDVMGDAPLWHRFVEQFRGELLDATTGGEGDMNQLAFPHARLSQDKVRHYAARLEALLDDLLAEPPAPDGEVFGLFFAMFKAPEYLQGPNPSPPAGAPPSHSEPS